MDRDDRAEIIEATARMAVLADRRDWEGAVGVFTPEVRIDYTAMSGGEPVTIAAADLVAGWAQSLGALDCTQHLVTNHLVTIDGDSAVATACFQAMHVGPAPDHRRWVLGGDYRYELVRTDAGWAIAAVTMTPRWQTGDWSIILPAAPLSIAPGD